MAGHPSTYSLIQHSSPRKRGIGGGQADTSRFHRMVHPADGGSGGGRQAGFGEPHTMRPVTQATQNMNGRNVAMRSTGKFRWTRMFQ